MRKITLSIILLASFLTVFFIVLFYSIPAYADGRDGYVGRLRLTSIIVEFMVDDSQQYQGQTTPSTLEGMIAEHGEIDRVELWCIFVHGSAIMEYVATLDNVTRLDNVAKMTWELEPIMLPISVKLPYYLKLYYTDGAMSPSQSAFYFSVTKPPVFQSLERKNNG